MPDADLQLVATDGRVQERVLVIGGEPLLPEVIATALEVGVGCATRSAWSAGEGLDAARRRRPSLVVVDLDELRADAGWLVAALRADAPRRPIIGLRAPGWREKVGLPGVPGCSVELDRPCAVGELFAAASDLMRRSRSDGRRTARPGRRSGWPAPAALVA